VLAKSQEFYSLVIIVNKGAKNLAMHYRKLSKYVLMGTKRDRFDDILSVI